MALKGKYLVDIVVVITIISPKSWDPDWPLQEINTLIIYSNHIY